MTFDWPSSILLIDGTIKPMRYSTEFPHHGSEWFDLLPKLRPLNTIRILESFIAFPERQRQLSLLSLRGVSVDKSGRCGMMEDGQNLLDIICPIEPTGLPSLQLTQPLKIGRAPKRTLDLPTALPQLTYPFKWWFPIYRNLLFQWSIFRGYMLVSGRVLIFRGYMLVSWRVAW